MTKTSENPVFQPTEKYKPQYDALDQAIEAAKNPNLSAAARAALQQQIVELQSGIALLGHDVGEFVYQ